MQVKDIFHPRTPKSMPDLESCEISPNLNPWS